MGIKNDGGVMGNRLQADRVREAHAGQCPQVKPITLTPPVISPQAEGFRQSYSPT
jgi:hypothetical protein